MTVQVRAFVLGVFGLGMLVSPLSQALSPTEILQKADKIRNPADSYRMKIQVRTGDDVSEFEVFLKGNDKTVIVTKLPARDRGRNMLMLDRDFYVYIPNLKRSVRLSLAQKLTGEVSNGDIARTRWAGDYAAVLEKAAVPAENQLLLTGNKANLTYQKIRAWLDKKNNRPLRAEYLSVDGKTVLKKAEFKGYKTFEGVERPSLIEIQDVSKSAKSLMEIVEMKSVEQNDSLFTERSLETLK